MVNFEGMLRLYYASQVKHVVTTPLGDLEPDDLRQTASHIVEEMRSKDPNAIALWDGSGTKLTHS
jgi:hypothetical protein